MAERRKHAVTSRPGLSDRGIDVLLAPLPFEPEEVARRARLLSADERARAERLRDPVARDRFVAGRGFLREMLGYYLDREPQTIRFDYGVHGKPFLAGEPPDGFRFNLSHAGTMAALAITRGREIGIDLETIRADLPFRSMAGRFFSPRERAEFFDLPADHQLHAFYRCWTRKEAGLKGRGSGFSLPADRLSVTLVPDAAPVISCPGSPDEWRGWLLSDIPVPSGFMAALAVAGGPYATVHPGPEPAPIPLPGVYRIQDRVHFVLDYENTVK